MCIRDRGIDVLNLVKTPEQLEQATQQMLQQKAQQTILSQTGQLAGTPLMNPEKNPELADQASAVISQFTQPPEQ